MRLELFRVVLCAALLLSGAARAHVGHNALSVRGITVSTGALTLTTEAASSLGLALATVREQPMEEVVNLPCRASVMPEKRVVLTSRVHGKVHRLIVRLGARVAAGEELLELDSLHVQETSLELARVASELQLGRTNLARARALAGPGIGARRDVYELEASVRKSEIALAGLEMKLAALGVRGADIARARAGEPVSRVVLVTPQAGIVTSFPASQGKVVAPGATIIEIAETSRLLVEGTLSEAAVHRLQPGQPVRIRFASIPQRVYAGRLGLIGSALDETTRGLPVFVEVDNADDQVRPEMFGEMEIVVWSEPHALACPTDALMQVGPDVMVLSLEDGRYVARTVVLGHRQGDRVEVVSGLFSGDVVVTKGSHELATFFAPEELTLSRRGERNLGVSIAEVEMAPLEEVITVPATIEVPPPLRSFASSRVAGRVEQVLVRTGMRVREGQPVALVRSIEAGDLLVEYQRARASARFLDDTVTRTRSVVEQKVAAGRELVEVETERSVAATQVANLRRRLDSLGIDVEQTPTDLPLVPIRAPADGVVFHSEVELGAQVEPDRHLMEVVDTRRVWVEGDLPEAEAYRVKEGQPVRIRASAVPDRVLTGTIAFLEPIIDQGHRAMHVVVELAGEQDGTALRPGMLGDLTIVTGRTQDVIRAPGSALLSEGGEHSVFLRHEGKLRRQRVEIGRADDLHVEVLRGVYPGEEIAVTGVEGLKTASTSVR